jgi:hypothetical protein
MVSGQYRRKRKAGDPLDASPHAPGGEAVSDEPLNAALNRMVEFRKAWERDDKHLRECDVAYCSECERIKNYRAANQRKVKP